MRTVTSQSRTKRTLSSSKNNAETWSYKYMKVAPKKIAYPPSNVRYYSPWFNSQKEANQRLS